MVHGLRPHVAIMQNGITKGAAVDVMQTLRTSPGLADIWQLHYAESNARMYNAPAEFIANQGANCKGFGIKMTARTDGRFTIENERNHKEKSYR